MQSLINSCRINWKANELTWEISLLNWDRTFPSTNTTPRCHVYGVFIYSTQTNFHTQYTQYIIASIVLQHACINKRKWNCSHINQCRSKTSGSTEISSNFILIEYIGNSEIETIFHFKIRTRFRCSRNTTFVPYLFFKWQKMLILNLSKVN